MSETSPGLVDTNIFIHAQSNDALAEECRQFLRAVHAGRVLVQLDPLVAHELSYALPHYRKGMTRDQVAEYLLAVLAWDGVVGDKAVLLDTVQRWRREASLAFVDAYLAARAARNGSRVYTKNVRHLASQGIAVPEPLPSD